jgi:hypothetical protein
MNETTVLKVPQIKQRIVDHILEILEKWHAMLHY